MSTGKYIMSEFLETHKKMLEKHSKPNEMLILNPCLTPEERKRHVEETKVNSQEELSGFLSS